MLPLLLSFLAVGPAFADPVPAPLDPDEPAADPPVEESIWDYIEAAEGAPPAPQVLQASAELAAERLAELQSMGAIGAEPPADYYTDPVKATNRDPLFLDKVDPREFDIPIAVNDMVKGWMNYFLGRGRGYYTRYLQRSTKWIPMMHREITRRNLPKDLIYLSMIESGFTTSATSYASAAGLWQFMPATARQYGLRVDWWVDERRDPEKATKAALDYLTYLANMFDGNWWLAWASYNGGEGRVQRATRSLGTTDFWTIVKRDSLHSETENYVPKLIAAAIIGKHPERYGFVGLRYEAEWKFDAVEVPAGTSIDVLARCAGMTEDEFVEYNPALRRWALPPDPENQSVRIAFGRKAQFEENFSKIPPEERVTYVRHVVRRGESVGAIASKYGVSTEAIVKVNRLSSSRSKLSVGMELMIPGGKAAAPAEAEKDTTLAAASPTAASSARASSGETEEKKLVVRSHKVRSGETMSGIASKYGLSVSELQKLNGLKRTTVYAGETLVVKKSYTTSSASTASTASSSAGKSSTSSSTKSSSSSSSKSKTTTYTVRKGDSLGAIADRYGCTVAELKAWNGLKGSTIYPGQRLKIKG